MNFQFPAAFRCWTLVISFVFWWLSVLGTRGMVGLRSKIRSFLEPMSSEEFQCATQHKLWAEDRCQLGLPAPQRLKKPLGQTPQFCHTQASLPTLWFLAGPTILGSWPLCVISVWPGGRKLSPFPGFPLKSPLTPHKERVEGAFPNDLGAGGEECRLPHLRCPFPSFSALHPCRIPPESAGQLSLHQPWRPASPCPHRAQLTFLLYQSFFCNCPLRPSSTIQ